MKKYMYVLLFLTAGFSSCKKPEIKEKEDLQPGTLLYSGNCGAGDNFYWVDSESIFLNDHCEGTLKKINAITKSVQLFTVNKDHLLQYIFVTEDIPGLVFYTALTKDGSGSFNLPAKLFSLNLATSNVTLVQDNISESPRPGSTHFAIGGKKLALKDGKGMLVVDLENNTSEWVSISNSLRIKSFSPDDTKILIDTLATNGNTNTLLYDLNCKCKQPTSLITENITVTWPSQAIFGYKALNPQNSTEIEFFNLSTGAPLKTFDVIGLPWIGSKSSLAFVWVHSPSASDKGILMAFDLVTLQTEELFTGDCCLLSVNNDVQRVTLSPDGKKLAFNKGGYLRIINM